ncbi:hypothetical protein Tco_1568109, partial [Tanacetum coccineum]
GMYHCKNVDFVELLWEDFSFQIDNHFSKESMPYPRFTKIIINHFISQNKSISMRNKINLHTARDDSLLGTLKYVSKTEEHQVYGALIPKEMLNEDILNSTAYKTYYAYANSAKEPKKARKFKKPSLPKLKTVPVSPKEPTKKPGKAKKYVTLTKKIATKPKPTKKKTPIKADRGKGDGTNFESGVLDEQQRKISSIDEGTGAKLGVPDVPKYDSESEKESWGNSGEEEEDDDDDTQDDDDDDDKHEEKEEEYVDEFTDKEDDADNAKEENEEELDDAKELYKDVNVNLRKEDVEMTDDDHAVHDTQKTEGPMQSSSVSSYFTEKLQNFENVSPADNEIASLMDTTIRHEEPSGQTSSLYTVPVTVIPEITFNDRVTNLERDLSEMKQVDQYAQAISSISTIVDRYIDNKLGEDIQQAIKSHTAECREEALADRREYEEY